MIQHNQNANGPIRVYNLPSPRQPNQDKKVSVPYEISREGPDPDQQNFNQLGSRVLIRTDRSPDLAARGFLGTQTTNKNYRKSMCIYEDLFLEQLKILLISERSKT